MCESDSTGKLRSEERSKGNHNRNKEMQLLISQMET